MRNCKFKRKNRGNNNVNDKGLRFQSFTTEMPTDHLLQAKDKFQELYKEQKCHVGELQDKDLELKQEVEILEEKKKFLKESLDVISHKAKNSKEHMDIKVAEQKTKLAMATKARDELSEREQKIKNQLLETKAENEKLDKVVKAKSLEERIRKEIHEEEIARLEKILLEKETLLNANRTKKEELLKLIREDSRLESLRTRKELLEKNLLEKENELTCVSYKVLEAEHLQKLAVQQKEAEADERRNLADEYERLRSLLEETEKINELKVQRKIKENEALELRKVEAQLLREQRELVDIKEKTSSVHLVYKKLKGEVEQMENRASVQKKDLEDKKEKLEAIQKKLNELRPQLVEKRAMFDELTFKENSILREKEELEKELEHLDLQNSITKRKIEFINKNFDFGKIMNMLRVDDLKQQLNDNLQASEAIASLIQKIDTLKEIQRKF